MKSFALCASLLLLATGSAGQKSAPAAPAGMAFDSVYIVFLRRPANPTQYDQAKLEDIQKGHLAHLGEL